MNDLLDSDQDILNSDDQEVLAGPEQVGSFWDDLTSAASDASASLNSASANKAAGDLQYANLNTAWLLLEAKGKTNSPLYPDIAADFAEWFAFSTAWDAGAHNYAGLAEQQQNLQKAQAAAQATATVPKAPPPQTGPAPAPKPPPVTVTPVTPPKPPTAPAAASAGGLLSRIGKTTLVVIGAGVAGVALVVWGLAGGKK